MKARRGYTMIEVMMALAILAVGASGVMALQRVTLIANSNARNVAMANQIAAAWADRLQADAVQWNNPETGSDLNETRWLNMVTTAAVGTPTDWFVPDSSTAPFGSAYADINGNEMYGNPDDLAAYCTHVRLTQLYPTMIRAEIRVFWARNERAIDCSASDPAAVTQAYGTLGFVYVTTGILNNVIPDFTDGG